MRINGTVDFVRITTSAAGQLLPLNRARVAFYVFPPNGGVALEYITISNDPNVTDGAGLTIYVGAPPVLFDRATFGDLVTQPWYAKLNGAATRSIGVVEAVGV